MRPQRRDQATGARAASKARANWQPPRGAMPGPVLQVRFRWFLAAHAPFWGRTGRLVVARERAAPLKSQQYEGKVKFGDGLYVREGKLASVKIWLENICLHINS